MTKTENLRLVVSCVSHAKTRCIKSVVPKSIALCCRAITMSPATKHHLSSPQIRMGQGYIPKSASFRSAWHQDHTICKPFPINTCELSEQVTFGSQPRKQLHTLTPNNANFTILSAVTNIFILTGWGHILLFYGAQYGHNGYSQTSDFHFERWSYALIGIY